MEAVGILLSPVIRVVIEKLLAPEIIKLTRQGDLHKAIQKLKTTLENINEVLDDAEEKQLFDKAVNKWLKDLHHLAYDAEDLLDEFATEALRRKLEEEEEEEPEGSSSSKVRIRCLTPTCSSVLSPSTLRFNSKMRSKIEDINEKLQDVATKRTELGLVRKLVGKVSTNVGKRTPETSLKKESRIWGRDEDIRRIIQLLLGDASTRNKVDVIPIVGMAGIGKTTLAQFVYNDEKVKDHFNLQAWVCVANESGFDVESITKAILESFTHQPCHLRGLNEVQVKLKETLAGRKFLLVLDDVWNCRDENWSSLRPPFEAGAHGSKIIVTTRNREVSCMPTAVEYPNLYTLSQDDCWEIFVQQASQNGSIFKHPELESIGNKIADKCGGLPLAARALGGLLRCKENEKEWQEILNSNIWNLPYAESGVLPALILSYHHLPSHLKRCFQYCAIIPKDYEFEEDELVLLWMAEGLIKDPEGRKQMEDLGLEYFHELVSRSLFQMSSGNKSKFKMHDLINDLAQSVAGDICFKLEDNLEGARANKISNNARHSSYVAGRYDGIKRFEAFHDARSLRTFIQFVSPGLGYSNTTTSLFHDVLPKFKCLHSLSLHGYVIYELPHSIGDLKRLRYLNLSSSMTRRLPDSIGTLYNLEVLLLKHCLNLQKLPRDMGSLVNLRHFDTTNSIFSLSAEMPFQIGKLTSLQMLSNFMVGSYSGQKIGELRDLSQIQGNICISRLENVRNARDASEANLKSKQGLKELSLEWDADHNPSNDRVDMDVLEMLKPHILLEQLTIKGYGSTTFPIWVGDAMFYKMESLRLENCKHCTSLPPFGQLPSLKELQIEGLSVLEHLGSEFYGKGCPKPFPLLERLSFVDMPEWNNWSNFGTEKGVQPYSRLHKLFIGRCPKLIGGLPNDLPCLESLEIENCPKLVGGLPNDLPCLKSLKIKGCLQLQLFDASRNTPELGFLTLGRVSIPDSLCDPSLPDSYVVLESAMSKHLGSVTELTIEEYGQLKFVPKWFIQGLLRLEILRIQKGKELVTLWHNEATLQRGLPTLRHLEVYNCPQLVSLFEEGEEVEEGEGMGWMPQQQQQQLPCMMRLENLDIYNCEMLKKLPRGLHTLTSLAKLRIYGCSSLVSFPKTGLPPMLRQIEIGRCNALQFLPELVTLNNLEVLYVYGCSSLPLLCSSGLPSVLKRLQIRQCENLVLLVAEEGMEIYCPSLEYISIRDCESLKTLPNAVHSSDGCSSLRNLRDLQIKGCNSLMSIPEGWFHPSINMRQLTIESCKAQLPPLGDHRQLTSLRKLNLRNCPPRTFSYFIKEGTGSHFLTSLTRLDIGGELLPSPSEWGLDRLSSLEELCLEGPISVSGPGGRERDFQSFPEEEMLLPASLTTLSINNFPNLEKLSFQNLHSLKSFFIVDCPRLRSFPKEGLPPSLLHLSICYCPGLASFPKQGLPLSLLSVEILECPRLKQRCEKGKCKYNIAYIPSTNIQ